MRRGYRLVRGKPQDGIRRERTDTARAIETATRVLWELKALGGEATPVELADQLELWKSTIYNHPNTLHAENLVIKAGDHYRPGLVYTDSRRILVAVATR